MPGWLRSLDSTLRTNDEIWLEELSQFVEKTISVVKDANLLADVGGPIVMLQIENEYGNMESYYGLNGRKYVEWLSEYALGLDVGGVPWVMCQQGEGVGTAPSKEIVNACNGFYCDNWISDHASAFPDQPHMWTENWPGWFQNWGEPIPHRPAVDVAFAVARWFARGGSYMNYYMAFGGSTFGRHVGGPLIVTSYDYDVQINEYGMRAEPKFTLLQRLHTLLLDNSEVLLSMLPPSAVALTSTCESHTYTKGDQCLAFLSNWGERSSCSFPLPSGESTEVPAWSVTIATGANCSTVAYNTKTFAQDTSQVRPNAQSASLVEDFTLAPFTVSAEPIPSALNSRGLTPSQVMSDYPLEQLSVTSDSTDYLWYSTVVPATYTEATNVTLEFSSGTAGGGVFYIYVNDVFVASTLGDAGGAPIVGSGKAAAVNQQRRTPTGWASSSVADKSTVSVGASGDISAPLSESVAVSLNITLPASVYPRLDILSVSMGLKNYGPYLELIEVGITSNLTVDGLTLSHITHTVGLKGESLALAGKAIVSSVEPKKDEECVSLCWYSSTFKTPASVTPTSHLALDLASSMGKGSVYVNGHMLGRYWNITAEGTLTQGDCTDACSSGEYVGSYNGDKCRSGCGGPSQQYYKLPTEWLVASDR